MSEHTKEPWAQHEDEPDAIVSAAEPNESLLTVDKNGMAKLWNEADARRIVACVNACKGIPNEQLECDQPEFVRIFNERNTLNQQRDKLLVALKGLTGTCPPGWQRVERAEALIKEVEADK